MRHVLIVFGLLSLLVISDVHALAKETTLHHRCNAKSPVPDDHVVSTMCVQGKIYQIVFDHSSLRIRLVADRRTVILHRIPKGYDPSLVGADRLIGFLPESLQPYTRKNIGVRPCD